jgi:hypothetical protein
MKRITLLCIFCIVCIGCVGSKPIPNWTYSGFNNLEGFKTNYLTGQEKIAEMYFQKATEEIKKSGKLKLLAMAYLTRYAIEVAVLEEFNDSHYLRIDAADSDPQNRSYYLLLKGKTARLNETDIPKQYRSLLKAIQMGNEAAWADETNKINDPVSKLIAIGIITRYYAADEAVLNIAIETASRNGWKKALLVYLEKLRLLYEAKGIHEKARKIQQQIQLINH